MGTPSPDFSTLFPRPFCHNASLQHYRLLSVTNCVTREKLAKKGRRNIPLRVIFVRMRLAHTRVNTRGKKQGRRAYTWLQEGLRP